MLAEHFPNVNFIFATRHPEATLTSLYRVMQREFSTIFHRTRLGWLHTRLVYPFPYDQYEHIKNRLRSSSVHWRRCLSGREQFLALSTAASLACFLQPSSSNVYCKVMLYEDLLAHPEREMLSLLHTMGVSPDYLHLAQTAMSFDSQAKAFGADENNSPDTAAAVTLNQEAWRYVDEIYEEMNLSVHRTMTLDEYREVLAGQTLRSGTWKAWRKSLFLSPQGLYLRTIRHFFPVPWRPSSVAKTEDTYARPDGEWWIRHVNILYTSVLRHPEQGRMRDAIWAEDATQNRVLPMFWATPPVPESEALMLGVDSRRRWQRRVEIMIGWTH